VQIVGVDRTRDRKDAAVSLPGGGSVRGCTCTALNAPRCHGQLLRSASSAPRERYGRCAAACREPLRRACLLTSTPKSGSTTTALLLPSAPPVVPLPAPPPATTIALLLPSAPPVVPLPAPPPAARPLGSLRAACFRRSARATARRPAFTRLTPCAAAPGPGTAAGAAAAGTTPGTGGGGDGGGGGGGGDGGREEHGTWQELGPDEARGAKQAARRGAPGRRGAGAARTHASPCLQSALAGAGCSWRASARMRLSDACCCRSSDATSTCSRR
jgi:hypothetical protein